jgi:hypothetical protein
MSATHARTIRHLRELIAALDWRVPQVKRSGEAGIAREAATLKAAALARIVELEREVTLEARATEIEKSPMSGEA